MNEVLSVLKKNSNVVEKLTDRLVAMQSLFTEQVDITPIEYGVMVQKNIEITRCMPKKATEFDLLHAVYHKKNVIYPDHAHTNSIEYFIVIKGKFSVRIDTTIRVVTKGECCSVPVNAKHSVYALEDDSVLIAVCIPAEKAYAEIFK